MKRIELEKELNDYLDVANVVDACPNGLQVEGKDEIKKAAFAVTASLYAIEKAVEEEVDCLFVHHGIFWDRVPQEVVGTKKKKIELLLKHGISLFAYHLPLDKHEEIGNNWKAAQDLNWRNLEPFGNYRGDTIGVRGSFSIKDISTFQRELENYYGHVAHVALGGGEKVMNAALISGGAHWSIIEAIESGVECFITGSFDEPIYTLAMEEGINFFAMGHHHTERVGPRALMKFLQDKYEIKGIFIEEENPF